MLSTYPKVDSKSQPNTTNTNWIIQPSASRAQKDTKVTVDGNELLLLVSAFVFGIISLLLGWICRLFTFIGLGGFTLGFIGLGFLN